jgi:WD40-like Beta Propeller Repeat
MLRTRGGLEVLGLVAALVAACSEQKPPEFTFYQDRVAPVLEVGCVQQTTGCHIATAQRTAAGNLDLTSFEALMGRADALPATGPYSVGQLLLKGGDPIQIPVQTLDPPVGGDPGQTFVAITTDVRHAGGRTLRLGSQGYALLKSWISQGYQEDGAVAEKPRQNEGSCRSGAGSHPGFDPGAPPADADAFARFQRSVAPVLARRCAGSSCHGSAIADLYLSCGDTPAEQRWNFFAAVAHLDISASQSELLRRPLSTLRGGTFHEGGNVFTSTDDPDFVTLRDFASYVADEKPELLAYPDPSEGLRFFANYVQPVLVKKGCMFGNCHSPSMFHDLRLRGGSTGLFSRIALDRNYEMARALLSLESEDPNQSRLIAKNLFPPTLGGVGMAHRGGALFEDFEQPATPDACTGVDATSQPLDGLPAYCVLAQWHAMERAEALSRGELEPGPAQLLAWVERPTDVGDVRDFDTYRPGADLLFGTLTLDGAGRPSLTAGQSVLSVCGLDAATADVRGPAASWDGQRVAFAARSSASAPFRLYEIDRAATRCAPIAGLAASATSQNGILTHDFDPAYAPDGRLVFASTRGNVGGSHFAYEGPQRTPSQLAPNANLYVLEEGAIRQLTYLSNQELMPSFMADGRLIFTTEKRAPDFFQLALRRLNLDGGDYHPLFAQRASVGFEVASEVAELANRNFVLVASHPGAEHGAGTLAIVNRSIGPDQSDRDPADKVFVHALTFPAPGAFDGQAGAFRSPVPLPSEWLVASCDPDARSLSGSLDFDLCGISATTGEVFVLGGVAGRSEVEGVLVAPRTNRGVFQSRPDEANAHTRVEPGADDAEVHVADLPLFSTLVFANTRTGRPIDPRVGGVDIMESFPPPTDATSFSQIPASQLYEDDFGTLFVQYEKLGNVLYESDFSSKFRYWGGHPIVLRLTDVNGRPLQFEAGAPFSGEIVQREEMQFYPGERSNQGFKRGLFNGMCGGCHGSITGAELDVAVNFDVLTSASKTAASGRDATELRR